MDLADDELALTAGGCRWTRGDRLGTADRLRRLGRQGDARPPARACSRCSTTPRTATRQVKLAAADAERDGGLRLNALTALQVREHAHLSPAELTDALHSAVPQGLAARRALPEPVRAAPYDPQIPGVHGWTLGFLFDIIHTRDPWLHRIDLARATGHPPVVSAEHDGRIIADVVSDWARTHRQPFRLTLTGPGGGRFATPGHGELDESLQLDAVEFCRTLSGRTPATGLLATPVVF